jgi:2-keto-4-pentenoate hydratase/2-oxohepta-3-ene-1,7-dioic acid hydratase in catechol pathway
MLIHRIWNRETRTDTHALASEEGWCPILTPLEEMAEHLESGASLELADELVGEEQASLLAPVAPSKIICVGLNYREHAAEMDKEIPPEPLLFMKPPTALNHPGGPIVYPPSSSLVHHEGELAIVVGRRARRVPLADAARHILGYTCAIDVTARDIQRREQRYTRAKGFDSFCPLGPAIATADAFAPGEHRLELRVDGELRQRSKLDDFIFGPEEVVSFVSEIMTLLPGDVILTGTPHGVGPLEIGDEVVVEIDGIGALRHPVVAAPGREVAEGTVKNLS